MAKRRFDLEVERVLGFALPLVTWDQLHLHADYDTLRDRDDAVAMAAIARDLRQGGERYQRLSGAPEIQPSEALSARADALTILAARAADDDMHVSSYRRLWLGGDLLELPDVSSWIIERLPEPHSDNTVELVWPFQMDDGMWQIKTAEVHPRSALGLLAILATEISPRWAWWPVETVIFVLTGLPPFVSPIRATFHRQTGMHRAIGWHDFGSRVNVDIDPTVTPEQLATWWREVRRSHFPDGKTYRPQSLKHLRLAEFMGTRTADTTWMTDRADWNETVNRGSWPAEWRYQADQHRNFHRDARAAVARVIRADLR
jgi:hypothetical protein